MEDKFLMEQLLYGNKVITDLYLHGVIESNCDEVRNAFEKNLNEALKLHTEIFKAMQNANFYNLSTVQPSKIEQTKTKLTKSVDCCLKEE